MELNEKASLHELLKHYPFLLDFLVQLSPAFKKLKNPVLRQTVARMASLKQVAAEGGMTTAELIEKIRQEIEARSGQVEAGVEAKVAADRPKDKTSSQAKIEQLKEIIRELHRGGNPEELKNRFAALIKDVGPEEIAQLEQQVIEEGMPEEEVKKLCDLHVRIFEEALEVQPSPSAPPGHPVHTLMAENRALEKLLAEIRLLLERIPRETAAGEIESNLEELSQLLLNLSEIEKHYLKKENQLFPLLEIRGVTGPTKVMWAIHDDIRRELKDLRKLLEQKVQTPEAAGRLALRAGQVLQMIQDMIYKEEKILFPMSLEVLKEEDWARVKRGEEDVGYAWVKPGTEWKPPAGVTETAATIGRSYAGYGQEVSGLREEARPGAGASETPTRRVQTWLDLRTGRLTAEQIDLMLTHLPVDISLVDENDTVIYYSDTPDRIFPRSPGVIGRQVQNCHPPKSVHIVNRILEAFKKGEKDVAEFWIEMNGRFIHIRYFAVRDDDGRYRGCLEVSQDVTAIRALQGQKRLLDWE
ncbi:MAG: DUF438 domain-containing protein [Candidatus Saccharicenans sp.]|uniref:DUF438 domain-containing protein n=1 Tax=Candidatus Saccharicenans sp. TaxID=2819258 RepID=UPI00404999CE